VPDPAEARDHLVEAEQDAVPVAQLAHTPEIAGRRHERAARVLDRLDDHHRDRARPGLRDRGLEVVEQEAGELLLALVRRPVVAVRVGDVEHVRDQRLERGAEVGAAVDRQRAHRRAVVGHAPRDRLPAPLAARRVVLAGELPGRLHGLGAARYEEHAVEVSRCELGDGVGQLDRPRVRVGPVDGEGQLAHLRRGGLPHLLAEAIAGVDAEEPCQRVQVAFAGRVLEVAAVALDDHGDVVRVPHPSEVKPEMIEVRH
jgi:hypothetical protein